MKPTPKSPMFAMTDAEEQILLAFRTMDQRSQDKYLLRMGQSAQRYPRHSPPALRLVAGGAS